MSSHRLLGPLVLVRSSVRRALSRRSKISSAFVLSLCSLLLSTCKEELPPYASPGITFSAALTPTYWVSPVENKLHLSIAVKNIYEETLEGALSIKGQVQLISREDPKIVKTFSIGYDNVTTATAHYVRPGVMAIDPGQGVNFDVTWDVSARPLLDDSGNDLTLGLLYLHSDPECPDARKKSDTHDFLIQSHVQVFDRTGPAVAKDVLFRFCLISNWVSPKDCPSVTAACSVVLSGGK